MSLLAEVVVEEWLNRQGYFTIRGARLGNDEMDVLAIRCLPDGKIERRHIECQVSTTPISYISTLPKAVQKATGRTPNTPKRSEQEIVDGVKEWVDKKFHKANKQALLISLGTGNWSQELVIHNVKSQDELELIRRHGIKILKLADIVKELRSAKTLIKSASGADLLELMHLASTGDEVLAEAIQVGSEET